MKLALLQVNGAAVQSASVSAKYGLDVSLDQDAASLRGNAFAEVVAQRSGGVIQNFKLVELQEPFLLGGKRYKATIEAQIAKFTAFRGDAEGEGGDRADSLRQPQPAHGRSYGVLG